MVSAGAGALEPPELALLESLDSPELLALFDSLFPELLLEVPELLFKDPLFELLWFVVALLDKPPLFAELFVPLMQLKRADTLGQNPVTIEEKLRVIDEIEEVFRNVTADGTEYNIRTLAINGSDLKALGISEGRQIGRILKQMLELVIEGSVENERESLLSAVREYLKGEGIAD